MSLVSQELKAGCCPLYAMTAAYLCSNSLLFNNWYLGGILHYRIRFLHLLRSPSCSSSVFLCVCCLASCYVSSGGFCRRLLCVTSGDDISISSTFEQKINPSWFPSSHISTLGDSLGRSIVESRDARTQRCWDHSPNGHGMGLLGLRVTGLLTSLRG